MKIDADLLAASMEASRAQQSKMAGASKYHRAALDGYIDMLCDASKRDTNLANQEQDGLTPTLMAAQSGQLEALRILVGRGGEPERTNSAGASALHLAAARGHLNCVSFLVNFGVNMWSLDNDLHTAKDAAAIEQRKEVLDYLDQMMAKQSALNTRNVQKLKEKAKVAAEKRLKLVRKAQLKAIKQAEKDERYLARLSHQRRLLRAAHSISDIKLVGRPSDAQPGYLTGNGSSLSGGGGGGSRSPSLANLMQHKLQMDLLGRSALTANGQSRVPIGGRSCASSTTDESSAYSSSSVSSAAGSGGKRSARPKYSDLVAVNEAERAKLLAKPASRARPTSGGAGPEHASVKSSSSSSAAATGGNKFWGIGGVSRKVQLRRLLRAGAAQSSSDLTAKTAAETSGGTSTSGTTGQAPVATSQNIKLGKLCNVQPSIKLKLNNQLEPARLAAAGNKWPQMTRAVSEPNFGAALRADDDDGEREQDREQDHCDNVDELSASTETKLSIAGRTRIEPTEASDKVAGEQLEQQCQSEETRRAGQQLKAQASQQQLLNQCLSQLKLRHSEALQQEPSNQDQQLLRPSRLSFMKAWPELAGSKLSAFGHSDELIQHQLSAGQFPLRPSLIKQHKQLQSRPNVAAGQQRQEQLEASPAIRCARSNASVNGVDSIGSAGSLAKRNSRPSSASNVSSSSSSSSSASCRSSSIDTAAPNQGPEAPEEIVLPPPPPPPLPPKTLSQATIQSTLAHRDAMLWRRRETKPKEADSESTIGTFLESNGLADLAQVFAMEQIDLEALLLLSEEDLKSLNVLLGPRRKLLKAIDRERRRLERLEESRPMYVVVDTQL